MNIRLQKYKKNRLAGMNKYNAARAAGFSESTAKSHTKRLEEQIKIADLMERQGLTDICLLERLSQLLKASKDIYNFSGVENEENGVTVKLGTPDWGARAKGLELALKMKELLKDKVEHSGEIKGGETKIIIIRADTKQEDKIGNQAFTISRPLSIQQ
jgi:phage terminase small subunit